jgi:urease accessory protein UreF
VGRRVRRAIVIGTAVAATAAIGGTALAHESGTVGDSFIGDFARHLGVSPAKVREAYQATVIDRIEAAVKAGRLTRAQADRIEAHVKSHPGGPFFFGGPRRGLDHGRFEHHGAFDHHGPSPFDAAATYLGVSEDALHTALASGRTLAQVATAHGKTASGLEAAMTASFRARLSAAVKAGRLTKQQAERFTRAVTAHLDDFVQHGFHHQFSPPHSEHS